MTANGATADECHPSVVETVLPRFSDRRKKSVSRVALIHPPIQTAEAGARFRIGEDSSPASRSS